MPEMAGLIDLTSTKRPPEVDIYLCAACMFFYGNPSGPCDLAYEFRPNAFFEIVSYAHVGPNSLNQITPLKDTATNKILSFKEYSIKTYLTFLSNTIQQKKNRNLRNICRRKHKSSK